MKILITGASSFLGKNLVKFLSEKHDVVKTYHSDKHDDWVYLDIMDEKQTLEVMKKTKPDIILHNAAIADPDTCEMQKERTWKINVEGTENVVKTAKIIGAKVVFISTDYVYDGKNPPYKEDDDLKPINHYGLTKVEGEKIVSKLKDYMIIRLHILYGYNDETDKKTFVTRVLDKLKRGEEIYLDYKQKRYPLLIDNASEITKELIEKDCRGIYNVGSKEGVTKFSLTLKIAEIFDLPKDSIKKSEGQGKIIVNRPYDTRFSVRKIESMGLKVVEIDEGLKIMKEQMGIN